MKARASESVSLPTCAMRGCARRAVILCSDGFLCCALHGGDDQEPRLDLRPLLRELAALRQRVGKADKAPVMATNRRPRAALDNVVPFRPKEA